MIVSRGLSTAKRLTRVLSTRASTILSSVGIPTTGEISGVYDGQWKGSGDLFSSICPTTGETLATVRTASPEELHEALERTREAYIQFRSNRLPHILHFTVISHLAVTDVPAPRRGELLRQIRETLASKAWI
jgi:aldehyde dehydrogenase family 7 protein A1